jgi:hypothetical protein
MSSQATFARIALAMRKAVKRKADGKRVPAREAIYSRHC